MLARTQELWQDIRSSWWFVPLVMAAGAVVLSFVTTTLDARFADTFAQFGLYAGGAEGTRSTLETVAGSMITVAGVAFSIAIVVMTLASSQFGPRLLRTFMRDAGNQITLGTFVATFLFSVLVLRTVRSDDGTAAGEFVPHLSVTVAILLTVASLVVFIYFIHHSARSIQVSQIIHAVGKDLDRAIDDLYPEQIGEDAASGAVSAPEAADAAVVESTTSGYVQLISARDLMRTAANDDVVVELLLVPGDFVIEGTALARVVPGERFDDELADRIRGAFAIGEQRTEAQDLGFAFDQLQQICLRALSPAVNDALTAVMCIDRMAAALARLAERDMPNRLRADEDGVLRVIARPVTLVSMLETAFAEIRRSARGNVTVSWRLLSALGMIGSRARRVEDLEALREACRRLIDEAATDVAAADLAALREAQREALAMMDDRRRQPSAA